ncbi:MAG: hypothetical protein JNM31_10285 [Flavobacteriales bacterium]|nr:hypothetical protein [Flavobacteriales bacterium]
MRTSLIPALAAFVLVFSSCGGGAPQEELTNPGEDSAAVDTRRAKARKIFFNIPSPMETATLLKDAGAAYDRKVLNDVLNVDRYTSPSKQALNLGVYGADLSYASVFNNTQESMFYTSCAKKLADRLGVSDVFSESVVSRMEKNRNDRDSLLNIISSTYWEVDGQLKDDGRDNISALMIAGGWIEGLYIATQVADRSKSPELRQRIAEQKLSLNDLIELLGTYPEDEVLAGVLNDLRGLATAFEGVQIGGAGETTQENGVTVIGGGPAASLTDDQLAAIRDKAATIRNAYIN